MSLENQLLQLLKGDFNDFIVKKVLCQLVTAWALTAHPLFSKNCSTFHFPLFCSHLTSHLTLTTFFERCDDDGVRSRSVATQTSLFALFYNIRRETFFT